MFRTKKLIGKKHRLKRIIRGGSPSDANLPLPLAPSENHLTGAERMARWRTEQMRDAEQRVARAVRASDSERITGIKECINTLCRSDRTMLVLIAISFIDKIRANIRQDESNESNRTPQDNDLLDALLVKVEITNTIIENLRVHLDRQENYSYVSSTHDADIGNLCTFLLSIFTNEYIPFFPSDMLIEFYETALRLTPNIVDALNNRAGKLYKKFKKTRRTRKTRKTRKTRRNRRTRRTRRTGKTKY
jgi:hypothetical protein